LSEWRVRSPLTEHDESCIQRLNKLVTVPLKIQTPLTNEETKLISGINAFWLLASSEYYLHENPWLDRSEATVEEGK
jgi:hypothetical protein